MSYRLFTYPINELIVAPDAVAEALNQACQRHPGLRLTGVCQSHDHVCFPTEEVAAGAPAVQYVLAPVHADTTDDLAAELRQRWVSHFTTLGLIYLPNTYLGLFARPAKS